MVHSSKLNNVANFHIIIMLQKCHDSVTPVIFLLTRYNVSRRLFFNGKWKNVLENCADQALLLNTLIWYSRVGSCSVTSPCPVIKVLFLLGTTTRA